jgi:hypothetical protein
MTEFNRRRLRRIAYRQWALRDDRRCLEVRRRLDDELSWAEEQLEELMAERLHDSQLKRAAGISHG